MEDALLLAVLSLFSFIIFRLVKVKMDVDDHVWQYPDAALLNCSCKGEGLFVCFRQGFCICRQDWPPTRRNPPASVPQVLVMSALLTP